MKSPVKVNSADFQRNFGHYQDVAMTQPVVVVRNGRERTVTVSIEEYRRLKRRDREVLSLDDFTEEDIAAIEASEPPESAKAFDHELDS